MTAHTPSIPHIETLRALAAEGAGYALLPEYTVRADRDQGRLITLRPRGLSLAPPIRLIHRCGQVLTPTLEAVMNALRGVRTALR